MCKDWWELAPELTNHLGRDAGGGEGKIAKGKIEGKKKESEEDEGQSGSPSFPKVLTSPSLSVPVCRSIASPTVRTRQKGFFFFPTSLMSLVLHLNFAGAVFLPVLPWRSVARLQGQGTREFYFAVSNSFFKGTSRKSAT